MSAILGVIAFIILGATTTVRGQTEDVEIDDENIELRHTRSSETIETLPRWPVSPRQVRGPREPRDFEVDGGCYSLGEIVSFVPELSRFGQLVKDAGYTKLLLNDRKGISTLVVPTNSAFDSPIMDRSYDGRYGDNMTAVIRERPDIMSSLVGAHVLKGLWTKDTFSARGTMVPKSNKMGSEGSSLMMEVTSGRGGVTFRSQGSDGTALMTDLAACGPSVVHVVDNVLLPFEWDAAAQDRTQLDNGNNGREESSGWGGWGGWGWGR